MHLRDDTHCPWTYQRRGFQIGTVSLVDVRIRFGKAVRNMQRLGVSQEEFVDMCHLDRTYLGGIARGERNLSLMNIEKVAKAFRLSLSELFKGV